MFGCCWFKSDNNVIFEYAGSIQNRKNGLDPAAASFAKNPRDGDGLTEGASIT
jgi:hypothetical protein